MCLCAGPAPKPGGFARPTCGVPRDPAVTSKDGLAPAHGARRIGSTGVSSLAWLVSRGHAGEAGQIGPAFRVTEAREACLLRDDAQQGRQRCICSPARRSPAEDWPDELRNVLWEASLSNFSESFPAPLLLSAATSLSSLVGVQELSSGALACSVNGSSYVSKSWFSKGSLAAVYRIAPGDNEICPPRSGRASREQTRTWSAGTNGIV